MLGFISCQKEIKYKGDESESFLVINGIIDNDSTIQISLSKSQSAIGEQNSGSKDIYSGATLILTDNTTGEVFTTNQVNAVGKYEFATKGINNHSYSLSVSHVDFPTATSQTNMPSNIPIISCDTNSTIIDGVSIEKNATLKWIDPDGENNYIIKVFALDTINNIEESVYVRSFEKNELGDQDSGSSNGTSSSGGLAILFKDETFNNSTKSLMISFSKSSYVDNITGMNTGEKSYKIVLYNVSKDIYNYFISTSKASGNNDNPFSEPVRVYTNIDKGLGIFGGVSMSTVVFE